MKTIKIGDKTYNLKYTFRAMMIYENINNQPFNPRTLTDVINFFYCVLAANNRDEELDYEKFIDQLDANPALLDTFSKWMVKEAEKQRKLMPSTLKEDEGEVDEKN